MIHSRDLSVTVLVVLAILLMLSGLWMSMWGMGVMGRWMSGYGVMGYGAGAGILALLAVLVGVALLIAGVTGRAPLEDPLEILKRRLPRGEISHQQYDKLRQTFKSSR